MEPSQRSSALRYALIGGGIALALMIFFLTSADYVDPSWPKFWMIRPLTITPLAGAMGGLVVHFIVNKVPATGFLRLFVVIFSLIVYIIALWLGSVLGLDGTYWD
jgi:hypothetical protein